MPHRDDQDAGVTARDVSADDAIAVAVINWELNGKKGRPSRAVRAALDSAGLVVVERKHMIGLRTELARCGLFGLVDTVKAMTGEDVTADESARQPEGDDGE